MSELFSGLLRSTDCCLLIVDVQEKLIPVIAQQERIRERIGWLLVGAQEYEVPVVLSEQYPDGLGATIDSIANHAAVRGRFDKLTFSATEHFHKWVAKNFQPPLDSRSQLVIAGIETHICVLQTALKLQQDGYEVFVVADAVGSRFAEDHSIGLNRLSRNGITVCTAESVLFEWAEKAGTESFRTISRMLRSRQE